MERLKLFKENHVDGSVYDSILIRNITVFLDFSWLRELVIRGPDRPDKSRAEPLPLCRRVYV